MENLQLPKPTRAQFEHMLTITNFTDTEIDFLNQCDWSNEIIEADEKFGLKNCIGEQLVVPNYENFMLLSGIPLKIDDKLTAMKNGLWGILIIDGASGVWYLEPFYDYIGYPNPIVACKKDNKWGILNSETKTFIIPMVCDYVSDENGFIFCNGVGFYEIAGKHGVILQNGEHTQAIFDEIKYEINEPIKVRIDQNWGYINQHGELTNDSDEAYFMELDY